MSRRERYREEVRQEAKAHAMAQLAENGPGGISVNSIAHRMGLSGPALYRYFPSRDALLTELISEAYQDLAETLESTAAEHRAAEPVVALTAMAMAFREWALAGPQRYLLLFGTPVPGYAAPAETIAAAQRALLAFAQVLERLPAPACPVDESFGQWLTDRGVGVAPSAFRQAVVGWSRMHGLLSLELTGQFALMGFDVAQLYRDAVKSVLNG
ncbi:TetR/AcrR family transcriptional regulator [Actinokineospora auranticolor]|uniref:AcrR family transcriptional regulator n=1 Tax=Actinokineospora auranticolor TaxID=155976 RepID=A0A2S6GWS9_9PSEU|nr:TetR/AcrR family transcriptional regulator [Actinokineospora auranticolor]PPK69669.1 AcrR family transcriptional regulator [Actinokineospora auranticolor]